jgi:hypothetical protein
MRYCEISKEMSSLYLGLAVFCILRLESQNLTRNPWPPTVVDCAMYTVHWTMSKILGLYQRPCITRRWTHAVLYLGWLNLFWKSDKLQRVCRTASQCSELSSCDMSCTPAVEEEDYDVIYYIEGPLNFQYPVRAEPLVFLTSLWTLASNWQNTSSPKYNDDISLLM